MPTYKILIEYDGSAFNGWQIQNGVPTVQETIEKALMVLCKERVEVVGSGRTDTGVHARGQVAHFRTPRIFDPYRLRYTIDSLTPASICIKDMWIVHDGFHARYDATLRRYHYYIATHWFTLGRQMRWLVRPMPDFDKMNEAASYLLGEHHFGTFCLTQSETLQRVCTLYKAQWEPELERGHWRFVIEGNRFLHGMVRAIVGTLLEVGHGKRNPEEMHTILAAQDRRYAGYSVPPQGLVLEYVGYEPQNSLLHPNQKLL